MRTFMEEKGPDPGWIVALGYVLSALALLALVWLVTHAGVASA